MFDYIQFSKFHTHNWDDSLPRYGLMFSAPLAYSYVTTQHHYFSRYLAIHALDIGGKFYAGKTCQLIIMIIISSSTIVVILIIPDITIKHKREKTCTLIDVAVPADRNVVQKEAEKKLKYKSLCIEIQRMCNMNC